MRNMGYIPERVNGGETIWIAAANSNGGAADITFTDYTPAGGYTLAYQFAAPTPVSVAAAANGANTGWTLEVAAATTLTWKSGRIGFTGYVTHTASTRVFAVDSGFIDVTASPLAASSWTAVVSACDAAILQYAANPNGSISVDGMTVSYRSLDQLTNLRAYAKTMEQQETRARMPRIIRSRFP